MFTDSTGKVSASSAVIHAHSRFEVAKKYKKIQFITRIGTLSHYECMCIRRRLQGT